MDQPFWSDHFDLDLPLAVPGARECLGQVADIEVFTNSSLTRGRINCPSAWNEPEGLTSFFSFRKEGVPPEGRSTLHASVPCTVWEAVRDLWIHQHLFSLDGVVVWNPTTSSIVGQSFEMLLYAVRGWRPIPQVDVTSAQEAVRASLREAAERIRALYSKEAHFGTEGTLR